MKSYPFFLYRDLLSDPLPSDGHPLMSRASKAFSVLPFAEIFHAHLGARFPFCFTQVR